MTDYVVFKDNHEEPILWYDDKPGRIEVRTPSGKYLYCEHIVTHSSGFKYKDYQFYRYRGLDNWVAIDDIKEFRFIKENYHVL